MSRRLMNALEVWLVIATLLVLIAIMHHTATELEKMDPTPQAPKSEEGR
jgi:hypothetical protein